MGAPISFSKGRARDPLLPSLEKNPKAVSKITSTLFLCGYMRTTANVCLFENCF